MSHRRGSSERHSALDRMRERRAMRSGPDEEEWPAPPPRRPPLMKGGMPPDPDRGPVSPPARPDTGGRAPRIPQSPRRERHERIPQSPRHSDPTRDKGEEERRRSSDKRRAQRHAEEEAAYDDPPPRRERGPRGDSEPARKGRSARGAADDNEEPLPASVKKADFKTLQEFISREIQESESVAGTFEKEVRDDDRELQKHREAIRRRREDEDAKREQERERARQQRRRAQEQARRDCEAEMRRQDQAEEQERLAHEEEKEQIKREFVAVTRLQALWRGRRSRQGATIESPALRVKAKPHARPMSAASTAAPSCHSSPCHIQFLA